MDINTHQLALRWQHLPKAIEQSKRNTMTQHTMTRVMTYVAEVLAVVLMLLLGIAILSI